MEKQKTDWRAKYRITLQTLMTLADEEKLYLWRAYLGEIFARAQDLEVAEDAQAIESGQADAPALDAAAEMIVDGCWNLANVDLELRRKHYAEALEMVKRLVAEAGRAGRE